MNWLTVNEIRNMDHESRIRYFESRLLATARPGIDKIVDFLHNNSDFYEAPASTMYHSDFYGGLLEHSLCVHATAMRMRDALVDMNPDMATGLESSSVELCALLHDVCKICVYTQTVKNIRMADGTYTQKMSYDFNDRFPIGHGEKSVIMLLYYGLQLSVEEMLAIRHHMGIQDALSGNCMKALNNASEITPLVSLIQSADYMATRSMEKTI